MPEDIQNLTLSDGRSRQPAAEVPSILAELLPIIGVVLVAYLVIGLALPVLPLHVHQGLGLSTFVSV